MAASAEALKAEGNAAYAAGDNDTALRCYMRAIEAAADEDAEAAALLPVLHSNASAAASRLPGKAREAKQHADTCVELKPDWPKGYLRQAAAAQLMHQPGDAERALRTGLKACPAAADQAVLRQELDQLLQVRDCYRQRGMPLTTWPVDAWVLPPASPPAPSHSSVQHNHGLNVALVCAAGRWRPKRAARLPARHPCAENA